MYFDLFNNNEYKIDAFSWMSSLFKSGRKQEISYETIYDVNPDDESSLLANRLERYWHFHSFRLGLT